MPTFNEPEQLLLKKWTDARRIEESMKVVRDKYEMVFDEVIDEVAKRHRDLNCPRTKPKWGHVAIGKNTWPKASYGAPSGFWIENVQLENLTSPKTERPYKDVWIFQPLVDPKETQSRLHKAAERVFSKADFTRLVFDPPDPNPKWGGAGFWCWLEQSRDELFELLVEEEARGFIDCMVAHFEWMAKLTKVIDEILMSSKRGRK